MVVDDVEPDPVTSMSPSHVEMTELAEIAKGHVASLVNRVSADSVMRLVDERVPLHLCSSLIGNPGGHSSSGLMGTDVVVVGDDLV